MNGSGPRRRIPEAWVRLALAHPRATLVCWALLALLASAGVARLQIETSTDSVLERASAEWAFYQDAQTRFGGDEIVVVVLHGDEPWSPATLAEVVRLSDALEGVPGVRRVDSLARVPLIEAGPDGSLSLDAPLARGAPGTREQAAQLAARLQHDRIAPRSLVSADGADFAVNVVLEKGPEARYQEILGTIARLVEGQRAFVSGVPIFRSEANAHTRTELLLFVPLTVLLSAALLFALFRSLAAVAIPLGAAGIGTWMVLGAMGALGVPLSITTVILPPVLLALGCAYTLHLLAAAVYTAGAEERRRAYLDLALPIALSGLTTAVGFVAIAFVRIQAVRDVGAFGALGVVAVLAAVLSACPAALELWPLRRRPRPWLEWLRLRAPALDLRFVERGRVAILAGGCLLVGVCLVGIRSLRVETDVVMWFQPDHPIRVAYDEIRSRLSGISPMNLVLNAPPGQTVTQPEVLEALGALTAYLEGLPEVGRAISLADPLRQLHGGFLGDPAQPLPEQRELAEQYLLLLDSVEPMGDLVTADRRAANVLLRLDHNGSQHLLRVARRAEAWWQQHGVAGFGLRTTGIMHEFARAEHEIATGQLRGLSFSFAVIAVILTLTYRSLRLAAIALVPNLAPVTMTFGAMGLLGVPLDAGTVLVGNLAFGIAVDNTVHVLSGFEDGRARGLGIHDALAGSLTRVLSPAVTSTLVISGGFLVLGLSSLTFTQHLGLLTAGLMVLCLFGDIWLLPAILLGRRRRRAREARQAA